MSSPDVFVRKDLTLQLEAMNGNDFSSVGLRAEDVPLRQS
jgi:hypothetical protein